jgi:hypothetical protein
MIDGTIEATVLGPSKCLEICLEPIVNQIDLFIRTVAG